MEMLYLLLGWLLGLLGPSILSGIKNKYKRNEIKKGILAELSDVKFKIASVAYFSTLRFGEYTRELNDWLIPIFEQYEGEFEKENILELLKKQKALSDPEFDAIVALGRAESGAGISGKKYSLPYAESKIGELSLFKQEFQRLVLEIIANMHLYNEEVDESWFYFRLTYEPGLSESNHERAIIGGSNCYKKMGERSKIIVERIIKLENI